MDNVLKYPGSKWKIARHLVELIPPHHSYVEPYFGSGAVLFNKEPSAIETVNDLDGDVVNLFRCIQQDSERLARLVMTTPYSREIYDRQFEPDNTCASRYQRAAGFLARMWQSYGSRNRKDGYKGGWRHDVVGRERMYALWDWYRLPEWIIEIAERLRKVQIDSRPAVDVISQYDSPDVFHYIDPPYLWSTRGNRKQYNHEMTDSDHEELLKKILRCKAKIMISGYESDMYEEYLQGWRKECFASYADGGRPRKEVVWMNYETHVQMALGDMEGMEWPNTVDTAVTCALGTGYGAINRGER